MRLFFQLSGEEQNAAVHYCVDLIMEDILTSKKFELDYQDKCSDHQEEDKKLEEHINTVVEEAKKLPPDQQFDYILQDQTAGEVIFDIAVGMAKQAYYHDQDELVIFPDSLFGDDDEENDSGLDNDNKKGSKSLN